MSFRTSLYCVSKKVAKKYACYSQVDCDNDTENKIYQELSNECVKSDTLTDIFLSDTTNKFSNRLFKNQLSIETDFYFGTINKEQLMKIIEEVRTKIVKWFDGRTVGRHELGTTWQTMFPDYSSQQAMEANQGEWNIKANRWKSSWTDSHYKTHYAQINVDMDNKWLVSGADSYEYLIFDLIHILKIFDWENNILLCIGG